MASTGLSYTINGVKVQFPHKPYPSQLSMMDKIIKGLNRKQNCLLESPTGSGKSLALLCSALAWQQSERGNILKYLEKARIENKEFMDKVGSVYSCTCAKVQNTDPGEQQFLALTAANQFPSVHSNQPVIIATTSAATDEDDDFRPDPRKHKLNTSVVGQEYAGDLGTMGESASMCKTEVEKPAESCVEGCSCNNSGGVVEKPHRKIPKIYFGTRTHKQIAQIARELGKTAYSDARMTILSSREHSCIHPQVSKMSKKNEECKNLLDGPGCRLFDNVRRKVSHASLRLNGLGTAWDLEDFKGFCRNAKACSYFGGRQLKTDADIVFCPYNYLIDPSIRESMEIYLKDQIVILDEAHNIEDSAREAASNSVSQQEITEAVEDLNKMIGEAIKVEEHRQIRDMLTGLYNLIESNRQTTVSDGFDSAYKMWTGIEMVAQLKNCGIGPDMFEALKKSFASISEVEDADQQKRIEAKVKLKAATLKTVGGLFTVLDFIYRENLRYMNDYRVALVKNMVYVNTPMEGKWLNKRRRPRQMDWTFSLNFWCLNPAVAFSDFGEACRSIILTSGTLSPMQSFQSELGVPFPIQLEAGHVIGKSQVWVGCISKGPRGTALLGNYQNSETFSYQDDLGALVYEVCSTVPHGVLCFVSSYKAIDKLTDRWKSTGLYDQLGEHKVIMVEPKASDKTDFDEVIHNYYEVIQEYEDADPDGITGAFFMAVCRGKVSEGLDFADNNARAVITVGIPFPNVKDPQVDLKKQYNNQHSASRGLLRGSDWYEIQAYRALNQALGRCIRHRNDWGALILVDERFGKNPQKYTKGLSKWVRQKVQQFYAFSAAKSSLSRFTQERLENPTTGDVSVLNVSCLPQSPNVSRQPAATQFNTTNKTTTHFTIPNGHTVTPYQGTGAIPSNISEIEDFKQQQTHVVQIGDIHHMPQDHLVNGTAVPNLVANEVAVASENPSISRSNRCQGGNVKNDVTSASVGGGFLMPHHPVPTELNASGYQTVSKAGGAKSDILLQTQEDIASKTVICGDANNDHNDTTDDPLEGCIDLNDDDFEFNPRMASTQMPRKGQTSTGMRSNKPERSQARLQKRGSLLSGRKWNVVNAPISEGKDHVVNTLSWKSQVLELQKVQNIKEKLGLELNKGVECYGGEQVTLGNLPIKQEGVQNGNHAATYGQTKHQVQSIDNRVTGSQQMKCVNMLEMKKELPLHPTSDTDVSLENYLTNNTSTANTAISLGQGVKKEQQKDVEQGSKVTASASRSESPDMFDSEGEGPISCDKELENVIRNVRNEMTTNGVETRLEGIQSLKPEPRTRRKCKKEREIVGQSEEGVKGLCEREHGEKELEEYDGQVSGDKIAVDRRSLSLGRPRKGCSLKVDIEEEETCNQVVSLDLGGTTNTEVVDSKSVVVNGSSNVSQGKGEHVRTELGEGHKGKIAVNQEVGRGLGAVNETVEEEAELLVTRRGSRVKKRKLSDGGNKNKKIKTKGVDFLDDLESGAVETTYHRVTCKACGKEICPKVKDITPVSSLPPYVKKVCENGEVSLLKPEDVLSNPAKSAHLELKMSDGMHINSYWSDTDCCCYKYLFCRCKGKTVALQVKCLGTTPHALLQVGQIWVFKDLAEIAPIPTDK